MCFIALFSNLVAQEPHKDSGADGLLQIRNISGPKRYLLELDSAISQRTSVAMIQGKQQQVIRYKVDTAKLGYMEVGEEIPEEVLDMPLEIVNDSQGRKRVTLRELAAGRDFLVLDFWAKWCTPCVASMRHWEEIKSQIESKINVVGVHMDYDYKAAKDSRELGWTSPQIVGKAAHIFNRYFFRNASIGPSVWIKDGRLFGRTTSRPASYDFIFQLIKGQIDSIPKQATWTPY